MLLPTYGKRIDHVARDAGIKIPAADLPLHGMEEPACTSVHAMPFLWASMGHSTRHSQPVWAYCSPWDSHSLQGHES